MKSKLYRDVVRLGVFQLHRTGAKERHRDDTNEVSGNWPASDEGRGSCCEHEHWRVAEDEAVLRALGTENLRRNNHGLFQPLWSTYFSWVGPTMFSEKGPHIC